MALREELPFRRTYKLSGEGHRDPATRHETELEEFRRALETAVCSPARLLSLTVGHFQLGTKCPHVPPSKPILFGQCTIFWTLPTSWLSLGQRHWVLRD